MRSISAARASPSGSAPRRPPHPPRRLRRSWAPPSDRPCRPAAGRPIASRRCRRRESAHRCPRRAGASPSSARPRGHRRNRPAPGGRSAVCRARRRPGRIVPAGAGDTGRCVGIEHIKAAHTSMTSASATASGPAPPCEALASVHRRLIAPVDRGPVDRRQAGLERLVQIERQQARGGARRGRSGPDTHQMHQPGRSGLRERQHDPVGRCARWRAPCRRGRRARASKLPKLASSASRIAGSIVHAVAAVRGTHEIEQRQGGWRRRRQGRRAAAGRRP